MKTVITPRDRSGYALLLVFFLTAACVVILASTLSRTSNVSGMNERNNQYNAGLYAAEAATEKVLARMKYDFLTGNLTYVTNNLSTYAGYVPLASEDPYWANFQFSDGQGHAGQTYVQCTSSLLYTALTSQYIGLSGWQTTYRVLSNAKQTSTGSSAGLTSCVQQDLQLNDVPVFQFAIFYNSLLEFTWAATLTVNGRTHANQSIFVGSSSPLTFNSLVTTTGGIYKTNWDGHTTSQYTGSISYNGSPTGYSTNAQVLQLPIGTNNTSDAVREIIYPARNTDSVAMSMQRYYNKAEIVLLVSNASVTCTLKTSTNDASPTVIVATNNLAYTPYYNPTNFFYTNMWQVTSNFPFLSITNGNANPGLLVFKDWREQKTVWPVQIDMGKLCRWITTNYYVTNKFPIDGTGKLTSGAYPNIMYVADFRTQYATNLPAIRLMDAVAIPTNMAPSGQATGFTVATPNPLYIWGSYNLPDFPASVISDALTVLSRNWTGTTDANSLTVNQVNTDAASTTNNMAIITGVVYSTGSSSSTFSGGVMNLPRLLEDWGNGSTVYLTLNTSIVNLYSSAIATNQFVNPGTYYYAPSRVFSFDSNFTNYSKLPPGTPMLGIATRAKWAVPPPNTVNYAGN